MKITIEVDENCIEEEVVIRCSKISDTVSQIQRSVSDIVSTGAKITLYKDKKEYYIPMQEILFFESDGTMICAHTVADTFVAKYKLYELEKMLPWNFTRVSKAAILNMDKIYAITKNITASSVVEFQGTPKQVYVSRAYYKGLMSKMNQEKTN